MSELCGFCYHNPALVTVTRSGEAILHLCPRCADVHQVVQQVARRETLLQGAPCLRCGAPSKVTGRVEAKDGRYLGTYRVCEACVEDAAMVTAPFLRLMTMWTPGVVDLPPAAERLEGPVPEGRG